VCLFTSRFWRLIVRRKICILFSFRLEDHFPRYTRLRLQVSPSQILHTQTHHTTINVSFVHNWHSISQPDLTNPDALQCCEYAALRLLFAGLCSYSAGQVPEGFIRILGLSDGLITRQTGEFPMSIYVARNTQVSVM
jgi:hypothetical protein